MRETETETDRQAGRQTDRDRERQRQRETDRDRATEPESQRVAPCERTHNHIRFHLPPVPSLSLGQTLALASKR